MAKSIMETSQPAWWLHPIRTLRAIWRGFDAVLDHASGKWVAPSQVDPIAALMKRRMGEVQRGEYDPVGIILQMSTPAGEIIFSSGRGPSLGRFHSDSQLDLIDVWEWDGLPAWYQVTDVMCPDCKAVCVECNELIGSSGHRVIGSSEDPEVTIASLKSDHYTIIDGFGKTFHLQPRRILIAGEMKEFMPGWRPCQYGNQLQCCGGTGVIPTQNNKTCPSCEGTGRVECRRCAGTGLMSTGKADDGKWCASCAGTAAVREKHEQWWLDYLASQSFETTISCPSGMISPPRSLEATVYLGPIYSLMLSGPDKATQQWFGKLDDAGNYPHFISQGCFQRGSRALILGGVLRQEQRNTNPSRRGRETRR